MNEEQGDDEAGEQLSDFSGCEITKRRKKKGVKELGRLTVHVPGTWLV